jgi:hypothetical protein
MAVGRGYMVRIERAPKAPGADLGPALEPADDAAVGQEADARLGRAEANRLVGEAPGVPLAVEPLLLGEGGDAPVGEPAGGGVATEAVDPEDST